MGGGRLQLSVEGDEDKYINNNPNLNIFKTVYMRHTNFTMVSIEESCQDFIRNKHEYNTHLPMNEETSFKVRIPRNGDLVNQIYLRLDLPKIYSDYIAEEGFKYTPYLGVACIKQVSLYIEDTKVETLTGEFLFAYHKLHQSKSKQDTFEQLIGHRPELYDPVGQVDQSYRAFQKTAYPANESSSNNKATIPNVTVTIPLTFWFSRVNGLALPLIALHLHQVYVEIELRPLRDLFMVLNKEAITITGTNIEYTNMYYEKSKKDNIDSFLDSADIKWNLNPRLEINYIFLDNKERNYLTQTKQQYLIEQVTYSKVLNISGTRTIEFELYHPIKEVIILPRRNDAHIRNQWFNFTNLDDPHMKYKDFQTYYLQKNREDSKSIYKLLNDYPHFYSQTDIEHLLKIWNFRESSDIPSINNNNHRFYDPSIIKSMSIQIDNKPRLELKDESYFSKSQLFNHYNGNYSNDILLYSFSRKPGSFQPTGMCNASEIDNMTFHINMKDPKKDSSSQESYQYDLLFHFVHYNILDIRNGMGGLVYGNR
jgi:hypothetical protein